jgi:hypothetical protein
MRDLVLGQPGGGRRIRAFGAVSGAALVVVLAFAGYKLVHSSGAAPAAPSKAAAEAAPLVSATAFQAEVGVRISQVAVTGAGGLVDLRFQVLDSSRAASVHTTPPTLVDESTGVVVNQLFMGHAHKGRMKAGQRYYLIFNNPGNLVERGSRVTVQLGAARVAHVPVR